MNREKDGCIGVAGRTGQFSGVKNLLLALLIR